MKGLKSLVGLACVMNQQEAPEKRGLCSMKSSSKMLQNLPYFIYTKTHFSFRATLFFP